MSDIFFLVVGIILSGIGILTILSGISAGKKCSMIVEGTVVDLKDKTQFHRGRTTHNITPVVKYACNGSVYESKAVISTTDVNKYHIGDNIEVYVNPNDPSEFTLGKTAFPFVFGIIVLVAGAILIRCYFL